MRLRRDALELQVDGEPPQITIRSVQLRRTLGLFSSAFVVAEREVEIREIRPCPRLDAAKARDLRRGNGALEIRLCGGEVPSNELRVAEPLTRRGHTEEVVDSLKHLDGF